MRFHGCGAVERVMLDGIALQRRIDPGLLPGRDGAWALDPASGVTTVRFRDTGVARRMTLVAGKD